MLTKNELLERVRDALNNLYDPNSLRATPLAEIFHVADQIDTPSALRNILVTAIEALKPDPELEVSSRAWRLYDALFYYYVQRFSQQEVADQLGLSRRQLRRETRSALESLVDYLWIQFDLQNQARLSNPESGRRTPGIEDELVWLRSSPTEKRVQLCDVLPNVLALVQNLADQYGSRFSMDLAEPLPDLAVNLTILRQALLSVLTVAIHYATQELITITADRSAPNVAIHVRARLCAPGFRPNSTHDTVTVEMAQQLFERCGGQLHTSLGQAEFVATILLPAVAQLPVLVIDDNLDTLALIQRYVSDTRYRVVGTPDPEQVIPLIREISPRVIILDVMMPDTDGWELLGRIRQQRRAEDIAVIVCTVLPQQELALSLGATDYVAKPISRQVLLSALDRHAGLFDAESR